jgi:hypothetical protein
MVTAITRKAIAVMKMVEMTKRDWENENANA